ncbi:MAG: pyridoxal phosphate-dependent aminotransferase [Thermoplasmata archaeon]
MYSFSDDEEALHTFIQSKKDIGIHAARLDGVASPATVEMASLEAELKAKGEDIISFSVGEPDFDTPKHIVFAAIKALCDGHTHYTPSAGIPELREAVAEKSRKENNIPCQASNVLITPAKLAVFAAILAFVDEGDEVIVPELAWVSYDPIIRLCGGKPVHVKNYHDDHFRILPEDIANTITKKTKMIIINSPCNPTGGMLTKEDWAGIADLAMDYDALVVSDEIYEKITYFRKHYSVASHPGMWDRTITVNGVSKAYAMTGWRIGWAVAPKHLLDPMMKIHQNTITCATSFAQKGAVAALRGDQSFVREMVDTFRNRRDIITDGLNSIDGFHCIRPHGAFYVFPRYDFDLPSVEMSKYLLKEAKCTTTAGIAFGEAGEYCLRFSYATSTEKIKEGLRRIEEAVKKLPRRKVA